MKTSNKVLLIVGLAILLSPLLFICFYVKAHYQVQHEGEDLTITTKSAGMATIHTKSFRNIVIESGKQDASLSYKIISSDQYGVKIPEAMSGLTSAKLNAEGNLEIVTNHKFEHNPFVEILIYAPKNVGMQFQNLKDYTSIYTSSDSFHLSAIDCLTEINLQSDMYPFKDGQRLSIMASNSYVRLDFKKLEGLHVNTNGQAFVDNANDTLKVNKLEINLNDKSKVTFHNLIANAIVGTIGNNVLLEGIDRSAVKKM